MARQLPLQNIWSRMFYQNIEQASLFIDTGLNIALQFAHELTMLLKRKK